MFPSERATFPPTTREPCRIRAAPKALPVTSARWARAVRPVPPGLPATNWNGAPRPSGFRSRTRRSRPADATMPRPHVIVVAGPPGSGKTRYFPVTASGVDAFARGLAGSQGSAGATAHGRLEPSLAAATVSHVPLAVAGKLAVPSNITRASLALPAVAEWRSHTEALAQSPFRRE